MLLLKMLRCLRSVSVSVSVFGRRCVKDCRQRSLEIRRALQKDLKSFSVFSVSVFCGSLRAAALRASLIFLVFIFNGSADESAVGSSGVLKS